MTPPRKDSYIKYLIQKFYNCQLTQLKLFKESGIDLDEYSEILVRAEFIWRNAYKNAGEICKNLTTTKRQEFQKLFARDPYKIDKDDCNVIPMTFIKCVQLVAGYVSWGLIVQSIIIKGFNRSYFQ
jgi:hypothetical protein